MLSISGSTINTTFTYDPNGNQTAGLGRSIGYTSYNKPNSITQGTRTITFAHDTEHQRFKQVAPEATTLTIGGFGVFAELYTTSAGSRWNEYLVLGQTMIGVRFLFADETTSTRYFHLDHLGSIAVITNESGAVIERNSHDPWGKRRYPDGTDDPTGSITSLTTQGYTGQEELSGFGLVHLNGRVYDPFIGRMISADPTVPEPMNAQAWNRYSYVINNPLAFTDPSGYSWLSEGLHTAGRFLRSSNIMGAIFRIAVSAICSTLPGCQPFLPLVAAVTSAAVVGITTGSIGAALQAGVVAGLTAVAFQAVGDITLGPGHPSPGFLSGPHIANIAGHALVGCASSAASGGKCGPGALSAGITSFAGPVINNRNDFVGSLVRNTVLGGLASVAAGDKFENGAITAAFGYLFNECGKGSCWTTPEERALVDRGDFLGHYAKACGGGDQYACFAYGIASGEYPGPGVTLFRSLVDAGYDVQLADYLVRTIIPDNLANAYANYLPQSQDQARFPLASDIAQFHWDEFAIYRLPPSTFGGTPFGASGPIVLKGLWCPQCR